MMSQDKFKHLMKDYISMNYSLKILFCLMSYSLTHCNRFRELLDFN